MATIVTYPKSLGFTAPSGVAITTLDNLTNAEFSGVNREISEFFTGNSRYPQKLVSGRKEAYISAETTDCAKYDDFNVGDVYTNVALVVAAQGCAPSGVGTLTVTLSKAIITEKGALSVAAEGTTPGSYNVRWDLHADCSDVTDPTFIISASGVA